MRIWEIISEGRLDELAPSSNPGNGGNYLQALASAWYNGTFNTGNLHKGIKSQEDVERILDRGIHCGDGKVRKYYIGYNANHDGVEIQSHDHYEYSDYDDAGNEIDDRTGQPWGPYDVVTFHGNELRESVDQSISEDQQSSKRFVLYLNGEAVAEYDNADEAKKAGKIVAKRLPNTQIEVKQETCTLTQVQLEENLKKCVAAESFPQLGEAKKRKRKAKSKRRTSSSNRSPVPRFYGAWGFGGDGEAEGGGE